MCAFCILKLNSFGGAMKKLGDFKNLFKANKLFLTYLFQKGKLLIFLQFAIIGLGIPLNFIQLYAPKQFIDTITIDNDFVSALKWIVILTSSQVLFYIISSSVNIYRQYIFSNAKLVTKEYTYKHFLNLYMSYYDNNEQLNKINRALAYGETGGAAFVLFLFSLLTLVTSLSVVTYVSFTFDWWIWVAIITVFVIKFIIANKVKIFNFEFQKERTIRSRKINYYSDVITRKDCLPEIKIYDASSFFFDKHRKVYIEDRNKQVNHDVKIILYSLAEQIPDKLFDILAYAFIGWRLYTNSASLGDYTMFFTMIAQINGLLNNFKGNFSALYEHTLAAKNYCDFIFDETHLIKIPEKTIAIPEILSIEFKNIYFKYANQETYALDDINFHINRGERVAIVGLNGAGKTTFIKLLLQLYRQEKGYILINGSDLENIDLSSYYKKIGIVFQNHNEYAITIAENIVFKEESEYNESMIKKALCEVGLDAKIQGFESKYNTPLTHNFFKNGVDFSGGERQKLSIARAIAKDCDLYIFDEPSSSLDAESENVLFEFINGISRDKTIIFISHRLSSALVADRVVVMKEGRIIGNAPHDQLIKSCPEYRQMYELQAKRYK